MRGMRAAGGIALLVLAAVLAIEALGPYLAITYSLSLSLLVVAILLAIGGVFLLQAARSSTPPGLDGMAGSVEDPHRPAPIRAPMMSNPSGGRAYAVAGGGAGIDNPEGPQDEEMPEEPE